MGSSTLRVSVDGCCGVRPVDRVACDEGDGAGVRRVGRDAPEVFEQLGAFAGRERGQQIVPVHVRVGGGGIAEFRQHIVKAFEPALHGGAGSGFDGFLGADLFDAVRLALFALLVGDEGLAARVQPGDAFEAQAALKQEAFQAFREQHVQRTGVVVFEQ